MAALFGTVRGKLTTLVALPVLLMFATLPPLSWFLSRQLVDEVDDRVVDAEKSFQLELDDDASDLRLALAVLSSDDDVQSALTRKDVTALQTLAGHFAKVYPRLDILMALPDGTVVADVGPSDVPARLDAIAEFADLARTKEYAGIVHGGCAKPGGGGGPSHVIAHVIAGPAGASGTIVVCEPLDVGYLKNTADKLGLELALLDSEQGSALVATTARFPVGGATNAGTASTLYDDGTGTWAVARFEPKLPTGTHGKLAVVAALDVSDIRHIVRTHLAMGLGVLGLAAALCLAIGSRIAMMMSRALNRVTDGLKKMQQQDYAHVVPVKTGDEMEDLATGFNTMVDGLKERDKLRSTFGKYMTAAVMDHLLKGKVALGGETLKVTILFSDIRSFTSISEKMDAHELVALLNEYFTEMVSVVMKNDGVVDKYIGDAIMAVFGAPVPRAEDAHNAVRAAVGMREALAHLNERLVARGVPAIRTGIGIHTGDVVAGNIGSEQRMEYTVIGDAVNLASRLESNTKELGVDVLISETTYAAVKDIVEATAVKEIHVKGRVEAVMTYSVTGLKGSATREER